MQRQNKKCYNPSIRRKVYISNKYYDSYSIIVFVDNKVNTVIFNVYKN